MISIIIDEIIIVSLFLFLGLALSWIMHLFFPKDVLGAYLYGFFFSFLFTYGIIKDNQIEKEYNETRVCIQKENGKDYNILIKNSKEYTRLKNCKEIKSRGQSQRQEEASK